MEWIQRRSYIVAASALTFLALGGYLGLVWSPPDVYQHDVMRIMYVHVPTVSIAYLAFLGNLIGSVLYLWKRDQKWDRLAVCAAEIGVLFTALTIIAGSIWAKPIWGVWWTWDARLTSTAILFVVYLGYLMFRNAQTVTALRRRQAAVVGIIGFLVIPVVHMSVSWWRSLHQGPTFGGVLSDPTLDDRMEVALFVNLLGFLALFLFLLGQRLRLAALEQQREELRWEEARDV